MPDRLGSVRDCSSRPKLVGRRRSALWARRAVWYRVVPGNGSEAKFTLHVSNSSALVGLAFFQRHSLDRLACNPFGVMSDAAAAVVGTR